MGSFISRCLGAPVIQQPDTQHNVRGRRNFSDSIRLLQYNPIHPTSSSHNHAQQNPYIQDPAQFSNIQGDGAWSYEKCRHDLKCMLADSNIHYFKKIKVILAWINPPNEQNKRDFDRIIPDKILSTEDKECLRELLLCIAKTIGSPKIATEVKQRVYFDIIEPMLPKPGGASTLNYSCRLPDGIYLALCDAVIGNTVKTEQLILAINEHFAKDHDDYAYAPPAGYSSSEKNSHVVSALAIATNHVTDQNFDEKHFYVMQKCVEQLQARLDALWHSAQTKPDNNTLPAAENEISEINKIMQAWNSYCMAMYSYLTSLRTGLLTRSLQGEYLIYKAYPIQNTHSFVETLQLKDVFFSGLSRHGFPETLISVIKDLDKSIKDHYKVADETSPSQSLTAPRAPAIEEIKHTIGILKRSGESISQKTLVTTVNGLNDVTSLLKKVWENIETLTKSQNDAIDAGSIFQNAEESFDERVDKLDLLLTGIADFYAIFSLNSNDWEIVPTHERGKKINLPCLREAFFDLPVIKQCHEQVISEIKGLNALLQRTYIPQYLQTALS